VSPTTLLAHEVKEVAAGLLALVQNPIAARVRVHLSYAAQNLTAAAAVLESMGEEQEEIE